MLVKGRAAGHGGGRIDEIEVLRAVAVMLVIVQHAGNAVQSGMLDHVTRWGGFGGGVDLFFVISGFVITRSLLPELRGARGGHAALRVVKQFWIRRIWRIWPAAWLCLAVILLVSAVSPPTLFGSLHTNAGATLAGIFNYANYRFAHMFGGAFYGASFQYWSLSAEEQFYVVLPFLILLSGRYLAICAVALIALQAWFNNPIFYWWSRDAELFYGVLLAMAAGTRAWALAEPLWLRRRPALAAAIMCGLLLLLLRCGSDDLGLPGRYSILALVATFIVWLAAYGQGYVLAPGRCRAWLVWLGSRSYALYLVHVPVLLAVAAISRAWPGGPAVWPHAVNHALTLAGLAVMIGLADAMYRGVERPFRDYGRRLASTPPRAARTIEPEGHARIDDIEALRAIAVGFVLVQHAMFNLVFNAGRLTSVLRWGQFWCGVDLFFVISGFLITRGLLPRVRASIGTRGAARLLRQFWLRRAWRLWPASWFWLAAILLGSAILRDPPILGDVRVNLHSALAGVLAFANLKFAAHPTDPYGPSYPYWSLALEEQFYLLLPLLMLALGRRLPWFVGICILAQLPWAHHRWFTYLRSDALLWGVALALIAEHAAYRAAEPRFLARSRLLGLALLVLCLAAMVRLSGPGDYSPPFAVGGIAFLAFCVVWLASYGKNYIGITALARPLLLWAGSRSYAIYLTHVPVYLCAAALSRYLGDRGDPVLGPMVNIRSAALAAPMLLAAAEGTYRWIERPLRAYGVRRSGISLNEFPRGADDGAVLPGSSGAGT